jgi:hypothetical protein
MPLNTSIQLPRLGVLTEKSVLPMRVDSAGASNQSRGRCLAVHCTNDLGPRIAPGPASSSSRDSRQRYATAASKLG